jgi:hypothetical protein
LSAEFNTQLVDYKNRANESKRATVETNWECPRKLWDSQINIHTSPCYTGEDVKRSASETLG